MRNHKSILDPRFKYVPAKDTNIAKTFKRIRRELAQEQEEKAAVVTPIKRGNKS